MVIKLLAELKSVKPKVTTATIATTKGILLQEPSESITTTITIPSKDKGKGIMVEEPLQMKKKDQIKIWMNKNYKNKTTLNLNEEIENWIYGIVLKDRKQMCKKSRLRPKDCQRLKETSPCKYSRIFDKDLSKRVNSFDDFITEDKKSKSLEVGTEMEESSKKVEVMEESSKRAKIAQENSSKRAGDELEQEEAIIS
ncbi:hypothetical protein Tco_1000076 [Tanacetum coccineum]